MGDSRYKLNKSSMRLVIPLVEFIIIYRSRFKFPHLSPKLKVSGISRGGAEARGKYTERKKRDHHPQGVHLLYSGISFYLL
jgi:hypothetical protein